MPTTTPSGRTRVPTITDAPDVPADLLRSAVDLEAYVTAKGAENRALIDGHTTTLASHTTTLGSHTTTLASHTASIAAHDALPKVKAGRVDRAIEGNGYLRLTSAEVFFSGATPTSIVGVGIDGRFRPAWDGSADGGGALLRVYNPSNNSQYGSGQVVAIYYVAVKM